MPIKVNSTGNSQEGNEKQIPQLAIPAKTVEVPTVDMPLLPTDTAVLEDDDLQDTTYEAPESEVPAGLTQEELRDPNAITVVIADHKTPIVVLYGPPSCGKTMTLVRMTRYLASQGYTVIPEKTFRPSYDENYKQLCDDFGGMINSNSAATSTTNISFMLVKVLKNGKPICQLLEAPGEHYFLPDEPNRPYPAYINAIFSSMNRKIWAIMLEPDWSDYEPRANYVTRISQLKSHYLSPKDKVLFVYNKIDLTAFVRGAGMVNTKEAINDVQNLYPNIFVPFKNENPITRFFTKYNCEFVPFMTGSYSQTMSGGITYTEGHSIYAQRLWQAILKLLNG